MEMKREQRLITEKYDFLEKTSHTENIQSDSQILNLFFPYLSAAKGWSILAVAKFNRYKAIANIDIWHCLDVLNLALWDLFQGYI